MLSGCLFEVKNVCWQHVAGCACNPPVARLDPPLTTPLPLSSPEVDTVVDADARCCDGKKSGFGAALCLQPCLDDIKRGHEERCGNSTCHGSDGLLAARNRFAWRALAETRTSFFPSLGAPGM